MNAKLFKCSLIIVAACLFTAVFQLWRLLEGTPVQTDLVFLGMSVLAPLILLYVSQKYWRIGLLFIIAYGVAKQASIMISAQSVRLAILLNLLSILFLIPALLFFLRLNRRGARIDG
jgi:hypothetical protein